MNIKVINSECINHSVTDAIDAHSSGSVNYWRTERKILKKHRMLVNIEEV